MRVGRPKCGERTETESLVEQDAHGLDEPARLVLALGENAQVVEQRQRVHSGASAHLLDRHVVAIDDERHHAEHALEALAGVDRHASARAAAPSYTASVDAMMARYSSRSLGGDTGTTSPANDITHRANESTRRT